MVGTNTLKSSRCHLPCTSTVNFAMLFVSMTKLNAEMPARQPILVKPYRWLL